ncbi:hypothetical protein ACQY0O_005864 [Thecaphora frezii]
MFSEDNRLASFKPAAASFSSFSSSSSKRRQTRADSHAPSWPHSTAKNSSYPSPSTLAKYGFYFSPEDDAPDRTPHYLYHDAAVTDWKAGDDPLQRLDRLLPGNSWSRLWRSKQAGKAVAGNDGEERWIWTDPQLLPTSKRMVEARKETFASCWPYDGKKGWKPTSKKLSEAGFYFTPTQDEHDTVTCIYCKQVLEGWEKGDDPIREHQEREPTCPFFTCLLEEPKESAAESDDVLESAQDDADTLLSHKSKRVVSTYSKRGVTRGKKATKVGAAPEETASEAETDAESRRHDTEAEDGEGDEEDEVLKPKRGRKARTASTKVKVPIVVDDDDVDGVQAEPAVEEKAKTKASIGKGRPTTVRTTRTASRAASKSKKAVAASDAESDAPVAEADLDESAAEATPIPRKASRSRGRPKKGQPLEEQEQQEDEPEEPETSKTPKATRPDPVTAVEETPSEAEQEAANGTIIEHPSAASSEAEDNGEDDTEAAKEGGTEEGEEPSAPLPPKKAGRAAAKAKAPKKETKKATAAKSTRGIARGKNAAAEADETEAQTESQAEAEPTETEEESLSEAEPKSKSKTKSKSKPKSKSKSRAKAKSKSDDDDDNDDEDDGAEVQQKPEAAQAKASTPPRSRRNQKAAPSSDEVDVPSSEAAGATAGGTVAANDEAEAVAVALASSPAPLRSPLTQLAMLDQLELSEAERGMTLGQWLQLKADEAAEEMRREGERQIQDLERRMAQGRTTIERTLRGT